MGRGGDGHRGAEPTRRRPGTRARAVPPRRAGRREPRRRRSWALRRWRRFPAAWRSVPLAAAPGPGLRSRAERAGPRRRERREPDVRVERRRLGRRIRPGRPTNRARQPSPARASFATLCQRMRDPAAHRALQPRRWPPRPGRKGAAIVVRRLTPSREYELVLMLDPDIPDERREQITAEARKRIESGRFPQAGHRLGHAQDGLRDRPAHRGRLSALPLRDGWRAARRPEPQPADRRRRPALPDLQGRPSLARDRPAGPVGTPPRPRTGAPRRPQRSPPRPRPGGDSG